MFKLISILAMALWISLPLPTQAEPESRIVRVVADEWPPMSGSRLPNGGFSVHLTSEVLQALGYVVRVDFVPWKRISHTRYKDEYDVVPAMWKNAERERDFYYCESYIDNKVVFVSARNTPFQFTEMASMNNKRIGIVSSYGYPKIFMEYPNVIWDKAIDIEQNIKKLLANRLDAVLGTEAVIRYEARRLGGSEKLYFDIQHPIELRPLHMVVNRRYEQSEKLVQDMDRILRQFKQNGRYDELKKLHGLL